MKIIGLMVCGPNEKYLKRSLEEFKRLCDDAMIATNNADEKTIKTIKEYGFKTYADDREWGIHQPDIKTSLLTRAGRELAPDWIIALDADEVFCESFTRDGAEALANGTEIAFNFLVVNLYNDEEHFAHSVGIQRFWNIRFYKYLPEYGLQFQRKALHCGLAPPIAYKYGWHAPYYLLHFGLMLPEDRQRKLERYRKYDPNKRYKAGAYYDELGQELPMRKFDPIGLLAKLNETLECKPRKTPKLPL